jgi:DNA polymerase-1
MYEQDYGEIEEAKFLKGWLEHDKVPRGRIPEWIYQLTGFRQDAKAVGFGINYGEGIPALAQKLGISKDEARKRKEKYFEPYPQVKEFIDYTHASCRETLEVHTILGRKRRLLEADADWKEGFYSHRYKKYIPERPGPLAARALRQAVNAVIQGSAADVARLAQILCEPRVMRDIGMHDRWSEGMERVGIRQLLQVHDEIVFEVPTESLKEGIEFLSGSMEKPFRYVPDLLGIDFSELSIPLDVDAGYGEAWSEAH